MRGSKSRFRNIVRGIFGVKRHIDFGWMFSVGLLDRGKGHEMVTTSFGRESRAGETYART